MEEIFQINLSNETLEVVKKEVLKNLDKESKYMNEQANKYKKV